LPQIGSAEEGGIGGSGHTVGEGGIGGTGHAPREGGIGGTGMIPVDTGIVGTVTGFGSICIQGIEIHYDAGTPIDIDGRAASPEDLAIGQVVEVLAAGTGEEVTAARISVRHELSGPVTAVDPAGNRIYVLGQAVELSDATRTISEGEDVRARAGEFRQGMFVDVSGLWRSDATLAASRVLVVFPRDTVVLGGAVTRVAEGRVEIGATTVEGMTSAAELVPGRYVRVAGTWDGERILAPEIVPVPIVPFGGQARSVQIEAIVHEWRKTAARVGPWTIELADAVAPEFENRPPAVNQRVQMSLSLTRDGRLVAERIRPARPLLPARAGRLQSNVQRRGYVPPLPEDASARGPEAAPAAPGHAPPRPAAVPRRPQETDRDVGVPEIPDRPFSADMPALPDRPSVPDRPSAPERPDRPQRVDRPQMPMRPEIPERPERGERPDRPERPLRRP
jgi:hypothetical protein